MGRISDDAKPNLFTRIVNTINTEILAKHRSFLRVIPEDCDLLSKVKESLERATKIDQEQEAFGITKEPRMDNEPGIGTMDDEFGIETEEPYGPEDRISWYKDASRYEPTEYRVLHEIFDYVSPKQDDIFLDLGSGKGRVVFFLSMRKLRRVVGVELRRVLFDVANRNSAAFKFSQTPIEFINDDVINYRIKDENLFFLYHPFGRKTFARVIDNIKDSLIENPRQIRIIYCNPVFQKILNDQEWLTLEKHLKEANCMIWQSQSRLVRNN